MRNFFYSRVEISEGEMIVNNRMFFISGVALVLFFLQATVANSTIKIASDGMKLEYQEADRIAEKLIDIKASALNYYSQNNRIKY